MGRRVYIQEAAPGCPLLQDQVDQEQFLQVKFELELTGIDYKVPSMQRKT